MSERRTMSLPLDAESDTWAYLTGTWPIPEAAWDRMLRLLDLMKPALVREEPPAEAEQP